MAHAAVQHSVGQIQLGPDTDGTVMIAIAVSIAIAIIGQRNFGRQGADKMATNTSGSWRGQVKDLSITHSLFLSLTEGLGDATN